jgi:hypothetical protein
MRIPVFVAVVLLAGCASEKLHVAPSARVDFTGHWKLNEAESDDPQRMIQAQFNAAASGQGAAGARAGRQGAAGGETGTPFGPVMPSIAAMADGLRWPGKSLDVKQVEGVVAFTSEGINRVCQPLDADKRPRHRGMPRDGGGRPTGRDGPPPRCGWEDKTLIVQGGDPDDERPPYEERYTISEDAQRLIEVVGFKGGRSNGYTLSRVWDRVAQ